MIVYRQSVSNFINSCNLLNRDGECIQIGNEIARAMRNAGISSFSDSQEKAWRRSLPFVAQALEKSCIDRNVDVAIEYKINQQKTRIDFLIYGLDDYGNKNVIIIELKQWSSVSSSKKPEYVFAQVTRGKYEDHWHPSYQALNYANSIKNFNVYVRETPVNLYSCSYLHNMDEENSILLEDSESFPLVISNPCFLKEDTQKLIDFLEKYVKHPSSGMLYQIDNSNLIPSDLLSHMLRDALKGNDFFAYDEAQRNAVSTIIAEVEDAKEYGYKKTIIVKGGAGTGKSVVAINTLGKLLNRGNGKKPFNCAYFTANGSPRYLYQEQLIQDDYTKNDIKVLFKHPQILANCKENDFDCGIFDEAHRIFDFKGGTGLTKDAHVLEKTIKGCQVSVFFIDEDQAVTEHDYATIERIKELAKKNHSKLIMGPELELTSQFRCLGGETYTTFIKSLLGYNNDGLKFNVSQNKYEFKVFDSPKAMFELIKQKDLEEQDRICRKDGKLVNDKSVSGKCRLVAGYTHNWISDKEDRNGPSFDFEYEDGFKAKWNLKKGGEYSWVNDPLSVDEIGCIHTSQGIDLNYCGVIIGKDLIYRDGKIQIDTETHPTKDKAFCRKTDRELVKKIIRNTYYVLLTRGIKGCYIYCEDKALNDYIKSLIIDEVN
jgi:DUF2075 family protein